MFTLVLIYETFTKYFSLLIIRMVSSPGKASLCFLLVKVIRIGECILSGPISFYLDASEMSFVYVFTHK